MRTLTRLLRPLALVVALAGTLLPVALKPTAAAPAVEPRIEVDRPYVEAGRDHPVYVLIEFDVVAAERLRDRERPPVNLALVLDRSGSMQDRGKLDYAKRAAHRVVDALSERDRLAVIEYDDRISVLWPSAPVESKRLIKRRIDALTPRGNTDLTGGMMEGVDAVRQRLDREEITRVMLLSDGLANHGITDPRAIRRLVQEAKRDGVRISTLGLGADYNEDLMQAIAENGGGRYYFIENPNQMAEIFRQELDALFTTVALDVNCRFERSDLVRRVEVFGFPSSGSSSKTRIDLEDFYGGETRSLLLRLSLRQPPLGAAMLGTLHLAYDDVPNDRRQRFAIDVTVEGTSDTTRIEEAINKDVVVEAALVEAEEDHAHNIKQFESGDVSGAQSNMEALAQTLRAMNADIKDERLAKKIEAIEVENQQMEEAATSGGADLYLKRSKQRLWQAKKGKRSLYMLQEGDKGVEVERLQQMLSDQGYYQGQIDGLFGSDLRDAVEAFQKDKQLDADGVAGPATLGEMGLY